MKDQIQKLVDDIKKKAELEARYYTGAIEGLQLLLSQISADKEIEDERPTEQQSNNSRKGNKPK